MSAVSDSASPGQFGATGVPPAEDRRLGALLRAEGKLSAGEVQQVLDMQESCGYRFGEAAVRLNLITVDDLRRAMAKQYDLPHLLPDNERISSEIVVAYEPFNKCAEQFRALRTQLLIRWTNTRTLHRTLAIVGVAPGEGRTYVAANLAVAFAQLGERTLLIDADLRRPRLHKIFDVPDRVGLSAVLGRRADRTALVRVPELGTLTLLPAGAPPPNPLELLSRDTLGAFISSLHPEFDVILLDTPAATTCADAQSVAVHARSALVLARKDRTPLKDTTWLIRALGDSGALTLGTVFNSH